MSQLPAQPRTILLIGFEPVEAARVALTLAEAGHRAHPAGSAHEAAAVLERVSIDLTLVDLAGAFAEVLGGIEAVRRGRPGTPLLAVGSVQTGAAMTDALRSLGLEGLIPRGASPQEMVFRVNRVLYAERLAASRVSPRVPVNIPACFDGIDGPAQGRVLNLSETGLFLAAEQCLPVNRSVTVRFGLEAGADPITATCRVVWTNAGGEGQRYFRGMGLQFLEMRPVSRAALQAFLARALAGLDANVPEGLTAGSRGPALAAAGLGHRYTPR